MGMYQGVNASEGIGIGTVMVAVDPDLTFEPHEVADSAAEKERYQSALSVFCEKTQAQADHMKETVGEAEAEIMSGHIVLAQDPGMTDAINAAIDGGTCAEQALMDTSTMFENMFLSMDDEMFRLRAADIATSAPVFWPSCWARRSSTSPSCPRTPSLSCMTSRRP